MKLIELNTAHRIKDYEYTYNNTTGLSWISMNVFITTKVLRLFIGNNKDIINLIHYG